MMNIMNILKKSIAFMMSAMLTATIICTANANAANDEYTVSYQEMTDLVNEHRLANGLPALKLDETLCDIAEVRAEEISRKFSHERPDGTSSNTVFNEFDVQKSYSGENIANYYKKSTTGVMNAWVNSEKHYENILSSDYENIGVGIYEKDNVYYWVQVFTADAQDINDLIDDVPEFIPGDVSDDGIINAIDASLVLSMYSQMSSGNASEYPEAQIKAADVNNDGVVNSADASAILKYYAALSTGLTPEF